VTTTDRASYLLDTTSANPTSAVEDDDEAPAAVWGVSVFADLDIAFARLCDGDDPVGLNCSPWEQAGLPARFMMLRELRDWLCAHPYNHAARQVVWRELVALARTGAPWVTAAAGMALPALVRAAGTLARGFRGDPRDIDAEILTGFLTALATIDLDEDRVFTRLRWTGVRAGLAARYDHQPYVLFGDIEELAGMAPHLPYGHPDLIVHRAVAANVIDPDDAELIMVTRLEATPIETLAADAGVDGSVLRMRRKRAETILVDAVTTGVLSGAIGTDTRRQLDRRAAARTARRTPRAA
jgi:hypothetical protein